MIARVPKRRAKIRAENVDRLQGPGRYQEATREPTASGSSTTSKNKANMFYKREERFVVDGDASRRRPSSR